MSCRLVVLLLLIGLIARSIWQGGDPARFTQTGFAEWLQEQEEGEVPIHRDFDPDFHDDGAPLWAFDGLHDVPGAKGALCDRGERVIIITPDGRSPVTVNCTRSSECGVRIGH